MENDMPRSSIQASDPGAAPATKRISFATALRDGLAQAMEIDENVFAYGIGADGKSGIFGTTGGLVERFGKKRVFDTPISEQALTALAVGAANEGLRPVLVHQRFDFALYAADQIVNWMGMWRTISGGRTTMPATIRAIVGKGWGQGPQHSKSLHSWFAHIPGLQVVVPGSPADAKGLLLSSILSDDPTLFIEGRSLFAMEEEVPVEPYFIRLGKAYVRRPGREVSVVTFGSMLPQVIEAAAILSAEGIEAEVVDLRCLAPLDMETVIESVARTGRLVVAEPGWRLYGAGAEIVAGVAETLGTGLKAPPRRVAWPHAYVPTTAPLEAEFYPSAEDVAAACRATLETA
jgi:pyruvate dehydrogenase E1 component beta subunit